MRLMLNRIPKSAIDVLATHREIVKLKRNLFRLSWVNSQERLPPTKSLIVATSASEKKEASEKWITRV